MKASLAVLTLLLATAAAVPAAVHQGDYSELPTLAEILEGPSDVDNIDAPIDTCASLLSKAGLVGIYIGSLKYRIVAMSLLDKDILTMRTFEAIDGQNIAREEGSAGLELNDKETAVPDPNIISTDMMALIGDARRRSASMESSWRYSWRVVHQFQWNGKSQLEKNKVRDAFERDKQARRRCLQVCRS